MLSLFREGESITRYGYLTAPFDAAVDLDVCQFLAYETVTNSL